MIAAPFALHAIPASVYGHAYDAPGWLGAHLVVGAAQRVSLASVCVAEVSMRTEAFRP